MADKIVTSHDYPPIGDRSLDWSARWDNDEPNDSGGMKMGHGSTEGTAISDLLQQGEEEVYERVIPCAACGTEGRIISWSGRVDQYGNPMEDEHECLNCDGTGGEIVKTQPIVMEDLA